jgi:hypothetical protein
LYFVGPLHRSEVLNGRGWSSANKVGGGGDVVCCCEVLGRFGGIEKLVGQLHSNNDGKPEEGAEAAPGLKHNTNHIKLN